MSYFIIGFEACKKERLALIYDSEKKEVQKSSEFLLQRLEDNIIKNVNFVKYGASSVKYMPKIKGIQLKDYFKPSAVKDGKVLINTYTLIRIDYTKNEATLVDASGNESVVTLEDLINEREKSISGLVISDGKLIDGYCDVIGEAYDIITGTKELEHEIIECPTIENSEAVLNETLEREKSLIKRLDEQDDSLNEAQEYKFIIKRLKRSDIISVPSYITDTFLFTANTVLERTFDLDKVTVLGELRLDKDDKSSMVVIMQQDYVGKYNKIQMVTEYNEACNISYEMELAKTAYAKWKTTKRYIAC